MDRRQLALKKILLSLGLMMSITHVPAQTVDSTDVDERRRRLIEQKYRLVESLVNAPVKQGRETEASPRVIEGRKMLEKTREAMAGNYLDRASLLLDEALRNASKVSSQLARQAGTASNSAEQENYRNLSEQVSTYRAALDDLAKLGGQVSSQARGIGRRVDTLQAEAGNLARAGQTMEANKKLAEAYKMSVESLSDLRSGQTVTLSLKFETSAEEFGYELKRFRSGEILVDMMLGEGRADGERRQQVDQFVRDGKKFYDTAGAMAATGKHKDAVTMMEQATAYLNRALQVMGIPVF